MPSGERITPARRRPSLASTVISSPQDVRGSAATARPASARTFSTSRTGNTSGRQGRASVPLPVIAQVPSPARRLPRPEPEKPAELAEHRAAPRLPAQRRRCQLALHGPCLCTPAGAGAGGRLRNIPPTPPPLGSCKFDEVDWYERVF